MGHSFLLWPNLHETVGVASIYRNVWKNGSIKTREKQTGTPIIWIPLFESLADRFYLYNMNSIPCPLLQITSSAMSRLWSILIHENDQELIKISKKFTHWEIEKITFLYQEAGHKSLILIFPHINRWNATFIVPTKILVNWNANIVSVLEEEMNRGTEKYISLYFQNF